MLYDVKVIEDKQIICLDVLSERDWQQQRKCTADDALLLLEPPWWADPHK